MSLADLKIITIQSLEWLLEDLKNGGVNSDLCKLSIGDVCNYAIKSIMDANSDDAWDMRSVGVLTNAVQFAFCAGRAHGRVYTHKDTDMVVQDFEGALRTLHADNE
jgi:hypothetical protein